MRDLDLAGGGAPQVGAALSLCATGFGEGGIGGVGAGVAGPLVVTHIGRHLLGAPRLVCSERGAWAVRQTNASLVNADMDVVWKAGTGQSVGEHRSRGSCRNDGNTVYKPVTFKKV